MRCWNDQFFARDLIPAGTYEGIGETPTISVGAQWVVGAEIDEELVYGITKALWHENARQLLDNGHAKGPAITLETALDGIGIPLHPGAERYYREAGLLDWTVALLATRLPRGLSIASLSAGSGRRACGSRRPQDYPAAQRPAESRAPGGRRRAAAGRAGSAGTLPARPSAMTSCISSSVPT